MEGDWIPETPPTIFLAKFKAIFEPKRNVSAYNEKAISSLVYEFNRTQRKASLDTISSQTALSWLKAERAIYPHQSDYCDYCSRKNVDIQSCAQSISRHLQSGSSSTEDFEELKKKKEDLRNDVEEHRNIARKSLQCYRHFKERCNKQWCEIVELESSSSSPERDQDLQQLQNTFTLLLSADYQMSTAKFDILLTKGVV